MADNHITIPLELSAEDDWDIWDYLRSFSDTDRATAIKAAIRDQMLSQDFESQILERLSSVETMLGNLQASLANTRVQALQNITLRGQFPEAEANVDSLVDF